MEDARQEALLSLMKHVTGMRAETAGQAAAWVKTIVRHKRLDVYRARRRDPVTSGLGSSDDEPWDRLASDDRPSLRADALHRLAETWLEHCHRALEFDVAGARRRAMKRLQAQAAVLRLLLGCEADEIAETLVTPSPPSKEQIYKWVERGRATLQLGLAHWKDVSAKEEREAMEPVWEVLNELTATRRADAGRPRPARRKRPDSEA